MFKGCEKSQLFFFSFLKVIFQLFEPLYKYYIKYNNRLTKACGRVLPLHLCSGWTVKNGY